MRPLQPTTPNAIVFVDDAAYLSILRLQRQEGAFSRFDLRRASERKERFAASYYAECYRAFRILPTYAERLKPYLAPALFSMHPEGILLSWQAIAKHLTEKNILQIPKPIASNRPVELINEPDMEPWMIPHATYVEHGEVAKSAWNRLSASDERSQLRLAIQLAAKWLAEGVKPERIVIANVREDDRFLLRTLARRYGFDVAQTKKTPLIQLPSVARFWHKIEQNDPFETIETMFSDPVDPIRLELLEIFELYRDIDNPARFWRFELERRSVEEPRLANAVRIAGWDELSVFDDARTIVLNACEGMFPTLRQDDQLCSDASLPLLGMRTSIEENDRRRRFVKRAIETIEDLVLITPIKHGGSLVVPLEASRFNREHVVWKPEDDWIARSIHDAMFLQGVLAFERKTYGTDNPLLPVLDASLPQRRPYDPRFKGIDISTAGALKPRPLVLSATSLETFFACRFRYLLTNLLHMEPRVPSLSASLGTAVHRRLERLSGDFEALALESPDFGPKRLQTFEIAVDRRLERVIGHLTSHLSQTAFTEAGTEKAYTIPLDSAGGYVLKGRIDRIMTYRFDDREAIAVIDYKTGNAVFSQADFEQGTDLQLIVYWELLRHQPTHSNAMLAGFFYQPVVLNRLKEAEGTDDFVKRMKMSGYVFDDVELAKAFDPGGFVRGLQYKTDGSFPSRAKRFDQDQLNRWLSQLQVHLQNAMTQIEEGDFKITPIAKKPGASESVSCAYCPFAGICYMANKQTQEDDDSMDDEETEE